MPDDKSVNEGKMETVILPVSYGGQHPILRPPVHSQWIVVGSWFGADGLPAGLDVHFDSDDPLHKPATAEDFDPLPGAAKLARAYNAPFSRTMRLRLRRSTDYLADLQVMKPYYRAVELLALALAIRDPSRSDDQIIVGDFDWSPSGTVYEDGFKLWTGVFPSKGSNGAPQHRRKQWDMQQPNIRSRLSMNCRSRSLRPRTPT